MRNFRVSPDATTCPDAIVFALDDDGRVRGVAFEGGCEGNARGLSRLVEGACAAEVAARLSGIGCDGKPTSCPDQLARALALALSGGLAPVE